MEDYLEKQALSPYMTELCQSSSAIRKMDEIASKMVKKYSKQEIYDKLCEILEQDFEVDKNLLSNDANLFADLDLDSIDAVDLAVRVQQYTEKRISPEDFKQIVTLGDVVDVIYNLL